MKIKESFCNMSENSEVQHTCNQHKKVLNRLNNVIMIDRTESETKRILKLQMQGLSPKFLNYMQ